MTPIEASILSNCRIESNRIEKSIRQRESNRIESNFFHPNRNALLSVQNAAAHLISAVADPFLELARSPQPAQMGEGLPAECRSATGRLYVTWRQAYIAQFATRPRNSLRFIFCGCVFPVMWINVEVTNGQPTTCLYNAPAGLSLVYFSLNPVLLSRPFSGLQTKTETVDFRSRDRDRDLGLQKMNSSALESRDHGLEITTLEHTVNHGLLVTTSATTWRVTAHRIYFL